MWSTRVTFTFLRREATFDYELFGEYYTAWEEKSIETDVNVEP